MGAYDEHYPGLAAGLKGDLASYTPNPKHWNPDYLISGPWSGSHNHGVAEAGKAMLSARRADALAVAPWWREYFDLSALRGLATAEARSGIYLELIAMGAIACRVGAARHGMGGLAASADRWLDALWSQLDLATFPTQRAGKWRVQRPAPWGESSGTLKGFASEAWCCVARGQRSWGKNGGAPAAGESISGMPTFGSLNLAIRRAIDGRGPWGFTSPWTDLSGNIRPSNLSLIAALQEVVHGSADAESLALVLSKCYPQHDGCDIVRFERGVACITHRKTHSSTAAMYVSSVHEDGSTEFVALDSGARGGANTKGGTARYDASGRRAVATAKDGQELTLAFPKGRYGELLFHVEFPAKKTPILRYPTVVEPPVEPPTPPLPEPPTPPTPPDPPDPPEPPPPPPEEENTVDDILDFIDKVDIDKLERIVALVETVLKLAKELDLEILKELIGAWKESEA